MTMMLVLGLGHIGNLKHQFFRRPLCFLIFYVMLHSQFWLQFFGIWHCWLWQLTISASLVLVLYFEKSALLGITHICLVQYCWHMMFLEPYDSYPAEGCKGGIFVLLTLGGVRTQQDKCLRIYWNCEWESLIAWSEFI